MSYDASGSVASGLPDIDYYGPDTYQAHHQNWKIRQHINGKLYVANSSGILEFDGEHWFHLSTPNLSFIYDIAVQGSRVYAGSYGDLGYFELDANGLWQFHSLKGELNTVLGQETDIEQIYRVAITPIGVFFLGAQYLYRYHNSKLSRLQLDRKNATYAISWIDDQVLIGNSYGELFRYDLQTNSIVGYLDADILDKQVIAEFLSTTDGDTLIVTLNGLFKLRIEDAHEPKITRFKTEVDDWINDNSAATATQLSNGNIAIGTRTDGLAIITQAGELKKFINKSSGLKHARVTGIVQDNQQGVWLTHDGGISRVALELGFYRFEQLNDLTNIQTILEHKNDVFAGSRTEGLYQLKKGTDNQFKAVLDYDLVWSLGATPDELIVAHSLGIDVVHVSDQGLNIQQSFKGLSHVYSLTKMDDTTFFATHQDGIARINKNSTQWELKNLNLKERIDHSILETPNTLWLGGMNQQYIRLENLARWPDVDVTFFGEKNGLPNGSTDLIKVDGKPAFITDRGVLTFEKNGQKNNRSQFLPHPSFDYFNQKNEIQLPYPAFQLKDGTLVLAKNKSFAIAQRNMNDQFEVRNTLMNDKKYGNVNQIKITPNMLWVAADKGIFGFNPNLIHQESTQPKLTLNSLTTDTGQIFNLASPLIADLTNGKRRTLSIKKDILSYTKSVKVTMTLSSLNNAEVNKYRWKIGETWSNWQQDGEVIIERLPTGVHSIVLQGKNSFNEFSSPILLKFTISPFWYETLHFRLLLTLIFGIILFFSIRLVANIRTQQLKQEKERLQALVDDKTKELQLADIMKTQFFCNLTHEIRTPLTLNIGYIEQVIDENPQLDIEVQQQLTQAARNAKRLLFLVNQVLDINRYAVQEEQLFSQTQDLNLLIKSISESFQPLAKQRGISLTFLEPTTSIGVEFDSGKMERIIVNLISNSFKFTNTKGHIEIELIEREKFTDLIIKDTGIGISDEQLPYIFDRFYSQNKMQKSEYASSGIGLSIVKSLVELHGGNIAVKNLQPHGCCFTLSFPLSNRPLKEIDFDQTYHTAEFVEIHQSRPINPIAPLISDQDYPDKKTILIVDDNAELRQFITKVFGSDYIVLEANHGQDGLMLARKYFPDLIICDLMMPVMGGFEFTKICKEDEELSFIPIFLLTANGSVNTRKSGFEAGADDFLEKPFELQEFKTKIRNFLITQEKMRERIKTEITNTQPTHPKVPEVVSTALTKKQYTTFSDKIKAYIVENIYCEINVETLAQQFHTDRSNLYRRLQKETGMSTQNFIKDVRLSVAADLLMKSEDNVSTVAYSLGYNNLSYFTRSFKAKYGCTPNQYRKA